jgi:hypothetical protein
LFSRFIHRNIPFVFVFLLALIYPCPVRTQEATLNLKQKAEVLSQADSILEELRAMRGSPALKPVTRSFQSKAQLRELLVSYSKEEKNQRMLEAERKTMVMFGLIPKDFPYTQFALNLLTEQIAGFYDFRTHELNLLDSTPMEQQIPTLAHELTHALQDRAIDLKRFNDPAPNNDDLTEAHQSLVEGDATAMMLDYLMKPLGTSISTLGFDLREMLKQTNQLDVFSMKILREAPRAIQTELMAPYFYGTSFFQYFRRYNAWPRVGAVYHDPPSSMEQIMHPDKYFDARDDPVRVSIPSPKPDFLKQWKLVDTNVLGELGMLIVLQQYLTDEIARLASEGWGGDQYQLYEDDSGRLLLLVFTTWDTQEDASQFFNSYRVLIEKKYPKITLSSAEERKYFRWSSDHDAIGLEIRDHDVIVIEGAPASDFESLRECLWKSKRGERSIPSARISIP